MQKTVNHVNVDLFVQDFTARMKHVQKRNAKCEDSYSFVYKTKSDAHDAHRKFSGTTYQFHS
jgi:hypothetical protein